MFNSIVLDTVIGMVFIFLLYSLLATILGELIANWLGLRARMLRQAIERMLNDGYDALSGMDNNLPPDASAEQKLFRRLRRIGAWVVSTIKTLGSFFLYEFKGFSTSMAGRFYNQPSIKYLTKEQRKGILFGKKKPSYIRPENFSETLIQLLKGKGSGETDKEKILYCIRYNTLHIQPETLEHIATLFKESGEDLEKFRKKLNTWYDEMMERLSGWFKRKIQLVLFLVGLIIAFVFNVDSIAIVKKLSKDKNAREQMVQMAIAASDSGSALQVALQRSNDSTIQDSLLRESYRQVKQASEDAGQILGLGWNFKGMVSPWKKIGFVICEPFRKPLMLLGFIITALAISLGSNFWFDLLKKLVSIRGSGVNPNETRQQQETGDGKPPTVEPMPSLLPFAAREEKVGLAPPALTGLAEAIANASAEFSPVPGVISIGAGFIKDDEGKKEAIEICLSDPEVRKKLTSVKKDQYMDYPVHFITTGPAVVHAVLCGDTIANENTVNGIGTAGCFVNKTGSAKFFLLSCWHVLKGDRKWNTITGANMSVVDKDGKKIARVVDGSLTDRIDAGFAEMLGKETFDNKKAGISCTWREVTLADARTETQVRFLGASSGLKEARIYNHAASKKLEYPDGGFYILQDLFSITEYDDNGKPCSPSSKGDSGAVVVDQKGYPLGLVVGGDEAFTYVAKLSNILSDQSIYKEYSIII